MNKNRNETDTLSKYPDIEIIRRDESAIGKSIPHDIPADIELIPMSSDGVSNKRAVKRAFSPDNSISKLTKLNDYGGTSSSSNSSSLLLSTKVTTSTTAVTSITTSRSSQQTTHLDTAILAHSNLNKCEYSIENTSSPVNNIITMSYNTKLNPPITISNASSTDADTILLPPSSLTTSSSISIHSMDTSKTITSRFIETEENGKFRDNSPEAVVEIEDEMTLNAMNELREDDTIIEETMFSETIGDQQYQQDEQQQHNHLELFTGSSDYSNEQIQETLLEQHNSNTLSIASQISVLSEKAIIKSEPSIDIIDSIEATTSMSALDSLSINDYNSNTIGSNTVNFSTVNDENSGNCNDQITDHDTQDQETTPILDNIYKLQNFEGVLQIQPNSLILEEEIQIYPHSEQHQLAHQMIDEDGNHLIIGRSMTICDDSNSSTVAIMADCSGDNSADTAVEELEPTIQNLEPIEDDPIEQKFTDAENYVLESGEISGDSGGKFHSFILYLCTKLERRINYDHNLRFNTYRNE